MTRLELLALMLALKALLEKNDVEKSLELINEVLTEARRKDN